MKKKKKISGVIIIIIFIFLIKLLTVDENPLHKFFEKSNKDFIVFKNIRKINVDIYQALFYLSEYRETENKGLLDKFEKGYTKNIIQIENRLNEIEKMGYDILEIKDFFSEMKTTMFEMFTISSSDEYKKHKFLEENGYLFFEFEDKIDVFADEYETIILVSYDEMNDLGEEKEMDEILIIMVLLLLLTYFLYRTKEGNEDEDYIYSIMDKGDEKKIRNIIKLVGSKAKIETYILKEISDYMFLYRLNTKISIENSNLKNIISLNDEKKFHVIYNLSYCKKHKFPKTALNIGEFMYENWDKNNSLFNLEKDSVPREVELANLVYFYFFNIKLKLHEEVMNEITSNSGTKFDPEIVANFLKVEDKIKTFFKEE